MGDRVNGYASAIGKVHGFSETVKANVSSYDSSGVMVHGSG